MLEEWLRAQILRQSSSVVLSEDHAIHTILLLSSGLLVHMNIMNYEFESLSLNHATPRCEAFFGWADFHSFLDSVRDITKMDRAFESRKKFFTDSQVHEDIAPGNVPTRYTKRNVRYTAIEEK